MLRDPFIDGSGTIRYDQVFRHELRPCWSTVETLLPLKDSEMAATHLLTQNGGEITRVAFLLRNSALEQAK